MAERSEPGGRIDRYFAAATLVHEHNADLHRDLVELEADDAHTRALLAESAAFVLTAMPQLTRELRELELEWAEQRLLDPPRAQQTAPELAVRLGRVEPELARMRSRQDEIATELLKLAERARGA